MSTIHLVKLAPGRARFARDMSGLTFGQAADRLRVSIDLLRAIEEADHRLSAEFVALMARIYDCRFEWLTGEDPELMTPNGGPAAALFEQIEAKVKDPRDREYFLKALACIGVGKE